MADDLALRGAQDRSRVDVNEKHEVAYWTRKFGVTAERLKSAVDEVGVMAVDLEKLLGAGSTAKRATGGKPKAASTSAQTGDAKPVRSAKPTAPLAVQPAAKKAVAKKTRGGKAAVVRVPDAIALLRADHKRVSELFDQFEKTRSATKKKTLVAKICMELTVHAQIEEEIFYPTVKAAMRDKELVPEATVEHASVKDLIAQVRDVEPDGEMYDARVRVMSEFVKHHVKEEQSEMFPKAKKTRVDMVALGQQLFERQQQLLTTGA